MVDMNKTLPETIVYMVMGKETEFRLGYAFDGGKWVAAYMHQGSCLVQGSGSTLTAALLQLRRRVKKLRRCKGEASPEQ